MLTLPTRSLDFLHAIEGLPFAACAFGLCIAWASQGAAQAGLSALPTTLRVPVLESKDRVRLTASGSYGFTEGVVTGADRHHRLALGVGAAASLDGGLGAELRMDGRSDRHTRPDDSGGVLDTRMSVRQSHSLKRGVSLGGQIDLWVPGKNGPRPAFGATTIDSRALVGLKPSSRLTMTASVGYRFDRSAHAVDAPERLSEADWISLGLSDFDAALLGVGAQHTLDDFRWFVEWTADLLVGATAPAWGHSPMRVAVGASAELGRPSTRATVTAQALVNDRARPNTDGPLVPFEARLSVMIAVSQDFEWGQAPPPRRPLEIVEPAAEVTQVGTPGPEELAPSSVLRVMVRDTDRGDPVRAQVRVFAKDGKPVPTEQKPGARAGVEMELSPGPYSVEVSADGFVTQRRQVSVEEQGVTLINVDLHPRGNR